MVFRVADQVADVVQQSGGEQEFTVGRVEVEPLLDRVE